jgi:hypothetical protein
MNTLFELRTKYNTLYLIEMLELLDFKDELAEIHAIEVDERLKQKQQQEDIKAKARERGNRI